MSSKLDKNVRRANKLSKTQVKSGNTFTGWHHSIKPTVLVDLKEKSPCQHLIENFLCVIRVLGVRSWDKRLREVQPQTQSQCAPHGGSAAGERSPGHCWALRRARKHKELFLRKAATPQGQTLITAELVGWKSLLRHVTYPTGPLRATLVNGTVKIIIKREECVCVWAWAHTCEHTHSSATLNKKHRIVKLHFAIQQRGCR